LEKNSWAKVQGKKKGKKVDSEKGSFSDRTNLEKTTAQGGSKGGGRGGGRSCGERSEGRGGPEVANFRAGRLNGGGGKGAALTKTSFNGSKYEGING